MSEHRIFVKRVALTGAVKLVTSLRGLILLPLLTKAVGATGYGIWSQIAATIGLLSPFIMLNLTASTTRFLASERDRQKLAQGIFTVITTVFLFSIVCALVLWLLADSFATVLLREPSASGFIKLAAALLVLEVLCQISLESFRIFGQIQKYSALTITQTILEIIFVAGAVAAGFGLSGALVALIVVRIIISSCALFLVIAHAGFALPDVSMLWPYLAFALPFLPMGLFDTLLNFSDRYIIGFYQGAAAVGVYSAAYSIGILAGVFIFPIAYILSPTIFKVFDEGNIDAVKMYLSYSAKYFLLLSIPAVFGLTSLAKPLLGTLATSEFILQNTMAVVLWVAMGAVFYGLQAIYGNILMIYKKTSFFMVAFGVGLASNVVLNIIFVPRFGVLAAAITTALGYGVAAFLVYSKSTQYLVFPVDPLFIVKSIMASLVMSGAIYFFDPFGLVRVLLAIAGGALLYFIALVVMGGFTKPELKLFYSALRFNYFSEKY